jgi:hypothetical protein
MAKKETKKEVEEREAIQNEDTEGADSEFSFETDFNAAEEYKVPPLVPNGSYEGYVTDVRPKPEEQSLEWQITLRADSDVLMSDNETPVNGNVLYYKNWFPRKGDEDIRTKTGKMSKRQAKINMMQDFQKKMRVNINTPADIMEGLQTAAWIGLEVVVTVEIREYEGRLSNQIRDIAAI